MELDLALNNNRCFIHGGANARKARKKNQVIKGQFHNTAKLYKKRDLM